jgi:hypothetical protein
VGGGARFEPLAKNASQSSSVVRLEIRLSTAIVSCHAAQSGHKENQGQSLGCDQASNILHISTMTSKSSD